jgi:hypothetical protein
MASLEQRISELTVRTRNEFNALLDGTKRVEIASRLDDGASGTSLATIVSDRNIAIQSAVAALLGTAPVAGDTLGKLYDAIQAIVGGGFVTQADIDLAVQNLINGSAVTLDTLKELADAIGNDPNLATTLASQISLKANITDVYDIATADATFKTIASYNAEIGNPDFDFVALFETGLLP